MKKRRISLVGGTFAAIILLVLAFLLRLSVHRPAEVALPEPADTESGGERLPDAGQEAIRRVEVAPDTVQRVIDRLARPEHYSRTITAERYYSGGSGVAAAEVRAAYGWTRLDMTEGGETRHVITGAPAAQGSAEDARSYVWYGEETAYFSGAASISADEEQSIPTYEDILRLPSEAIAAADYRTLDTVNCIYVETYPDASGYKDRYWISVETGLLAAAERMRGESVVYRMAGLAVDTGTVTAEAFTLPDGTVLFDPAAMERTDERTDMENEG